MKTFKDAEYTDFAPRNLYYHRDRLEFIHTFQIDEYIDWNPHFQMDDFGNAVPLDRQAYTLKEVRPAVAINTKTGIPEVYVPVQH